MRVKDAHELQRTEWMRVEDAQLQRTEWMHRVAEN